MTAAHVKSATLYGRKGTRFTVATATLIAWKRCCRLQESLVEKDICMLFPRFGKLEGSTFPFRDIWTTFLDRNAFS